MAELKVEIVLGLGWVGASPFIVVHQPSPLVRLKKGVSWKLLMKLSKKNIIRRFQLEIEIGDIIAKKGELTAGAWFVIWQLTGESFSATRSHLAANISNTQTEKV